MLMNDKTKFRIIDILLLAGMILPIAAAMAIKILFTPLEEGIAVHGARIFFTVPMPVQDLPITESQVNSWLLIVSIFFLCLYMTHGTKEKADTRRQHICEWIVEKTDGLVADNMGEFFKGFSPFVGAVLALSAFSSLMSLLGVYAPTSDINIIAGWAVLVFLLITYYKMKCGPLHYLKSFTEPVAVMLPMNIISEIATPVSMSFRHYGNVMSGSIISILIASALQGLSKLVLGWLPGFLGEIPFLQVGLPAVLSVYFDVFSGMLQAFIFAMLTMMYVAGAFPADDYAARQARKRKKNA